MAITKLAVLLLCTCWLPMPSFAAPHNVAEVDAQMRARAAAVPTVVASIVPPAETQPALAPSHEVKTEPVAPVNMAAFARIVGGTTVLGRKPWNAQVVIRYYKADGSATLDLCGGTLVTRNWGV